MGMTDFNRVFVDTAPYVYLLEHNDIFLGRVRSFFRYCISARKRIVTSVVTIEEFSVGGYKQKDLQLIADFYAFLYKLRARSLGASLLANRGFVRQPHRGAFAPRCDCVAASSRRCTFSYSIGIRAPTLSV